MDSKCPLALAWAKNRLARDIRHIVENHRIEWHEISAVTRVCARTVGPRIETILVVEKK